MDVFFFFSSRRRHTRSLCDWSSDVCSSDLVDLDDLATAVGEAAGGYYDWVLKTASVDGTYLSIPVGTSASAFAYRISYFEEAGIADAANNFPKTWEELFAVGKSLKEMG